MPDHTGCAHPTTSGRMWVFLKVEAGCTMHVREDVGGGGLLRWSGNQEPTSANRARTRHRLPHVHIARQEQRPGRHLARPPHNR